MKALITPFLCLLVLAPFAQLPDYAPESGLVAWYGLNGNGLDYSGNANDGIVDGPEPTIDRFGTEAGAMLFDEDIIDIASTENFDLSTFSVSLWLNTDAEVGGYQTGFSHFIDAWYGYWLGILGNQACLYIAGGIEFALVSSMAVNDGEWHMITATYDGTTAKLYVDGVFDGETEFEMIVLPCPTTIGADFLGEYIYGSLDDMGVWNRPLTECEIEALFDGTVIGINTAVEQEGIELTAVESDLTYLWVDCHTYEPIPGANDQTFIPDETGSYAVVLTDKGGCSVISECYDVEIVSVNEFDESLMTVYPIPSTGVIQVEVDRTAMELIIFNAIGEKVHEMKIDHPAFSIDLSAFGSKGVYSVFVKDANGQTVANQRVIYE